MKELIYGKDDTQRIVNISVKNDFVYIYQEDKNNNVFYDVAGSFPFVISNEKAAKNSIKQTNLFIETQCRYSIFNSTLKTKPGLITSQKLSGNLELDTIYNLTNVDDKYVSYKTFPYGSYKPSKEEAHMVLTGQTYFKGMKHTDPSILAFDIETTGLTQDKNSRVLMIANTLRKGNKVKRKLFCFNDFFSDREMLQAWVDWVKNENPSILVGHNIFMFDLPYLQYCASKLNVKLNLGRDDSKLQFSSFVSKFRKDGSQFYEYNKPQIFGRELIDTFFLAIRYDIGRKYETYGLKNIIKQEGLEVEGRQYYDAASIKDNFKNPSELAKIKSYAEHDGDDALALYDLMAAPYFELNKSVPKSFTNMILTASGSQLNSLLIRAYLDKRHSLPKPSEVESYEGGISEGTPGVYSNVFKVDVASMYPSIMLEYNVKNKFKDPFEIFPKLVSSFREERLKNKQLFKTTGEDHYKAMEQAQKIFINSLYGLLGARGINFNDPISAAFVTQKGREFLTQAKEWATNKGFVIPNCDTDSISFCHSNETELTSETRAELLAELNTKYPKNIIWEDDGYYKKVIIVKAKNYLLVDEKGKRSLKGAALKATSKEKRLQKLILDMLNYLIEDNENLEELYNEAILEAMSLNAESIKQWVSKKTITDKVLRPKRTNESKVLDAIKNRSYSQGDKVYLFFKNDDSLSLIEDFDGDYNKKRMLKKVFDTVQVFGTFLDTKKRFPNYTLKRNQEELKELCKKNGVRYFL